MTLVYERTIDTVDSERKKNSLGRQVTLEHETKIQAAFFFRVFGINPMQTWAPFVTTETLDEGARKTLDHIFSDTKTTVQIEGSYVDFGHMKAQFFVPWTGDQFRIRMDFRIWMDARQPVHTLKYVVPPFGPFAVVAQPLADAIAVELVLAYFKSMCRSYALRDVGEYEATFLPLTKLAVKLSTSSKMSQARAAVRKARILHAAALACSYTSATEKQRDCLIGLAVRARKEKCLSCLAFAVHVGVKLIEWKSRSLERMYTPNNVGYRLAQVSFTSHASIS
jgi:hypothetical protein